LRSTSQNQMLLNELLGLHIEITNLCTLKCAGCARTQFIKQWPSHWQNHSLNIDVLSKFLDINLNGKVITLCGNTGDCIYHPEFHSFLEYFKKNGAHLRIFSNGSYRSKTWWEQTSSYLDQNDTFVFSIDGLPENFTQYRINADWNSIAIGIEAMANSAAKTIWKYIPLGFNEDNINQAKELSKELGIDTFFIEKSNRFDNNHVHGYELTQLKPVNESLVDLKLKKHEQWVNNDRNFGVTPTCADLRSHFISADGFYSPCCFIADYRWYYKTIFGKQKNQYSISDYTISELFQKTEFVEFYKGINNNPICQFNCPNTQG
jgi:MoaA/NifB/PqqE/SkfB family radical SAM enzyme